MILSGKIDDLKSEQSELLKLCISQAVREVKQYEEEELRILSPGFDNLRDSR